MYSSLPNSLTLINFQGSFVPLYILNHDSAKESRPVVGQPNHAGRAHRTYIDLQLAYKMWS